VLTIKAAAAALAQGSTTDGLTSIAAVLGFGTPPLPLDERTRESLGVSQRVLDARIARGRGALRALLVELPKGSVVRTEIALLASRLASRSPHLLWLLIAFEREGDQCAVATWSIPRGAVRIAALVVDLCRILDSDAETLCALAAAPGGSDLLTHTRWQEILGRDALTRRFYRTLHDIVLELGGHAVGGGRPAEHHEAALLYVSRLLFLSFLEAKGWLNGDRAFLSRGFEECCAGAGGYEQRVLRPLFFGTLNTPVKARAARASSFGCVPFLNGGLFSPTPLERRLRGLRFGDEHIGRVYSELLGRYRFTAREDSTSWSEAAVDPEMLGKAFESLMASNERKSSGAFYTPHALVERVTRSALIAGLSSGALPESVVLLAFAGEPVPASHRDTLRERLTSLTVLDPACGSGAFLVRVLSEIAALRIAAGDPLPPAQLRRSVLTQSIFGVDLNPMAVWLCELRLWLAVVIESDEPDPLRVPPLPNLDHHIWVGDTLLGGDFSATATDRGAKQLTVLRSRYARSTGARKRALGRALERAERGFALSALDRALATIANQRRDLIIAQRGHDLFGERRTPDRSERARMAELKRRSRELRQSRRTLGQGGALPFSFPAHFPDVADRGGFDVVVGNPPWVRLHRIPPRTRELLRRDFMVFRNAAWSEGAIGARAGVGFASQIDLSALFVERSVDLLRDGGAISMLLPAKLWRSLAGGGVRHLLRSRVRLLELEDWSDSATTFDAAVYPSLLVALRRCEAGLRAEEDVRVTVHTGSMARSWDFPIHRLGAREELAAPWLLLPPDARRAFDAITDAGIPLGETALGRPMLGVKCGCNDAFVLVVTGMNGGVAEVRSTGRTGTVEEKLLRPVLRGGSVAAWRIPEASERLLWTHDDSRAPIARLPAHTARWLGGWRRELIARADAHATDRWWSLYRTEAATNTRPRVVWSDFGRVPRAAVLPRGDRTVPLNSCYVSHCETDEDALALTALLNSTLAAAWLNALAEPARGGFHRYLAWTVAMLPIPANWERARALLAPLARTAIDGQPPSFNRLLSAVVDAYGLNESRVLPLITWMSR